MAGGGYTRERARLTADHVRRARALVAGGRVEGRGVEWGDTACVGLTLRVTPLAATWYLRGRASTVRLGSVDALTVAAAREAATRARLDLKDGRDPKLDLKVFEHAMAATGDEEAAADAAWPEEVAVPSDEERRRRGPWQWHDLVDLFLEHKARTLTPGYVRQYASYLRHPQYDRLRHVLVRDLGPEILQEIRDDIVEANSLSAAARCVRQGREMMEWAWANHSGRSGLSKARDRWPMWRDQWNVTYAPGKRAHTPTLPELGRTLALAERHRSLGQTEHATGAGALAMLWFVVLTGQRTGQVAGTTPAQVSDLDAEAGAPGPGWRAVAWDGPAMKSRRAHLLPLPSEAWAALRRVSGAKDAAWLFPSKRGGGHVSPGALNQLLYRLSGRRITGATGKGPLVDLLGAHGVRHWTLHDVRRSLTSFLTDRRLGGAASAILDHEIAGAEDLRERRATVTRLHYDTAQRVALKAEGMGLWVAAVLEAYEAERAALSGLPAPALPPRTQRALRRPKAA